MRVVLMMITLFWGQFQARGPNMDGKKNFIRCLHVNDRHRTNRKQSSCTRFGLVSRLIQCTNNEQRRTTTKVKSETHYVTIGSY